MLIEVYLNYEASTHKSKIRDVSKQSIQSVIFTEEMRRLCGIWNIMAEAGPWVNCEKAAYQVLWHIV